jgi:hypothetical protein
MLMDLLLQIIAELEPILVQPVRRTSLEPLYNSLIDRRYCLGYPPDRRRCSRQAEISSGAKKSVGGE